MQMSRNTLKQYCHIRTKKVKSEELICLTIKLLTLNHQLLTKICLLKVSRVGCQDSQSGIL